MLSRPGLPASLVSTTLSCIRHQGERRPHLRSWARSDLVAGSTPVIVDIVTALEDAAREPDVAHELPEVLDRVEFGRSILSQGGNAVGNCHVLDRRNSREERIVGAIARQTSHFLNKQTFRMRVSTIGSTREPAFRLSAYRRWCRPRRRSASRESPGSRR